MDPVRVKDLVKHRYYTVCLYRDPIDPNRDMMFEGCKYLDQGTQELHFKYWKECKYVYLDVCRNEEDFVIYDEEQPKINRLKPKKKVISNFRGESQWIN